MEEIQELTDLIKRWDDDTHNTVEYTCRDGSIMQGRNLFNIPGQIAIQTATCPANDVLESHAHACHEWLIVYEGSCTVSLDGKEHKIEVGGHIYIPPGTPHFVILGEQVARLIGITVPDAEGYPGGR